MAAAAASAQAPAERPCYTVDSLQAFLAARYGEAIAFNGRGTTGETVTLFAGPAGTWTLVRVDGAGTACLIAAGTHGHLPKGPVFIPLVPEDPA